MQASKEDIIDHVNHLIDLGKERGFLTQEEINILLPSDVFSPKQIDDMKIMFRGMDIKIVTEIQKVSILNRTQQEDQEGDKAEVKERLDRGSDDRFNDPARSYLREMSSVSLLTREEEVEIAKRMEEGEKIIAQVVLPAPITLREIITIGEQLRSGTISVREVIRDLDEEGTDIDEEHYTKKVLSLITSIKRREQKKLVLEKKLAQKHLGKADKAALQKRVDRSAQKIIDTIDEIHLNKSHIDRIVHTLKHFLVRLETAEGEINHCIEKAKLPQEELKKLFRQAKKSRHEERKISKKFGISKDELLAFETIIKNARKKIKHIEAESTFDAQSLKKAIRSIEEGELENQTCQGRIGKS